MRTFRGRTSHRPGSVGGLVACLLAAGGCSGGRGPLPGADRGSDGGAGHSGAPTSDAGAAASDAGPDATACTGLNLLGEPVRVVDHPPVSGNLYTSFVWTGQEYLLVWRTFRGEGVFMRPISASGVPGDNVRLRSFEDAFDVTWTGSALAAAWTGDDGASATAIRFQSFDRAGVPLFGPVSLRSSTDVVVDGSVIYGPRITSLAGEAIVVWAERTGTAQGSGRGGPQILAAKVGPDGRAVGQPVVVGEGAATAPNLTVAAGTDRLLVGWTDQQNSAPPPGFRTSMRTALLSRDMALLATATLDEWMGPSTGLQLLSTDGGFLALWGRVLIDAVSVVPELWPVGLARIGADGDPSGVVALPSPFVGKYQHYTPAAWTGGRLLALWDEAPVTGMSSLTLNRLAADGTMQGEPVPVASSGASGRLHMAAHGDTVGFVWSEDGDFGYRVYFQQAVSCP